MSALGEAATKDLASHAGERRLALASDASLNGDGLRDDSLAEFPNLSPAIFVGLGTAASIPARLWQYSRESSSPMRLMR